jgi:hypothetical protein
MNKTWNVTITLRVTEPTEADALCTAKEYMEMAGVCISWDSVCKDAEVERAEEVRTEEATA